jgi:hypothetical protein
MYLSVIAAHNRVSLTLFGGFIVKAPLAAHIELDTILSRIDVYSSTFDPKVKRGL